MVNLNKHTMKSKPTQTFKFKNCVCVAQMSYNTQHRTILIILHPNLQTIIVAQMQSIGGRREHFCSNKH